MTHDEMIAKAYREWRELVEVTPSLDKPMEIAFVAGFRAAIRVIAPAVLEEAAEEASIAWDAVNAIRAMKTRYEQ